MSNFQEMRGVSGIFRTLLQGSLAFLLSKFLKKDISFEPVRKFPYSFRRTPTADGALLPHFLLLKIRETA
jgi:hypothetical protein